MKKNLIGAIIILGALILSACSGAAVRATATAGATSSTLSTGYSNAISTAQQLALGTLKLEESATPIDTQTASALLPLWKAVRSLSTDDSASQLEIQAVYQQIEETLPADQITAIAAMQLTGADLSQEIASLAPAANSEKTTASASSASNSNAAGAPTGGQTPPQDMNAGLTGTGGGGQGVGLTTSSTTTQTVKVAGTTQTSPVSTVLVDAVIALLEGKE
ncbi:hypothetical protein LARV_00699 [Longilinea arvoryzae]|uniref:Lipoprotein n=1 Tax=Longilinea arvoryzae TaxID=360412 RepID=A0A0S7B6V6_9CHLR|nr:hypothetical protein [Longilinea arvoryzae]GAP12959.1 hypothetical protein LARV_00699 [Longilinea arvoryzae]